MAYKETVTQAEDRTWPVERQVILDNPHSGAPQATFSEFWRRTVGGQLVSEVPTGRALALAVGVEPVQIPLLDANDDPIPGQFITDHAIAQYLRCAYFHVARAADAAEQASGGQ